MTYRRVKGHKGIAVPFERVGNDDEMEMPPPECIWSELQHGDLVYESDGYRGYDTWVVYHYDENSKGVERLLDGSEVPEGITRDIEDPLCFYSEVMNDNLYQGVGILQFDTFRHKECLHKVSGGREIHISRRISWASFNGYHELATPESPDYPSGGFTILDENTPAVYLSSVSYLDADPWMVSSRAIQKELHEVKASDFFRGLKKREMLSLINFPIQSSQGGGSGASGRFAWFLPAEGVVTSVGIDMGIGNEEVFIFRPRLVLFNTGPFGNVNVWASDNRSGIPPVWMINF